MGDQRGRLALGVCVGVRRGSWRRVCVGDERSVGVMVGTVVAVGGVSTLATISGVAVGVSVGSGGDAVGPIVTSRSGVRVGVGAWPPVPHAPTNSRLVSNSAVILMNRILT